MDEVLDALLEQQDELHTLVDPLDGDSLLAPSRCDGWTVADVLLHLARTNEMAAASARGELPAFVQDTGAPLPEGGTVDDWAGIMVEAQRTTPEAARDRWAASADAQLDAFRSCDPTARLVWVAGELAARSLATTRLAEAWIHTTDVAVAFGPEPPPPGRLWHVARLAWRTLPYAFARSGQVLSGPVAFVLDAPDRSTWSFGDAVGPATTVTGSARDLCTVAGQRAAAAETGLRATGPDAAAVLALVRTYA